MLELREITKTFPSARQDVTAVKDVSLSVNAGEFVAVTGPSGCGKSTLLLTAGSLLAPDAGTAIVNGTNLYDLDANQRAKFRNEQIGFVFQELHLVPYLSVLNNVKAPAIVSGAAVQERAMGLLDEFGLSDRLSHRPGKLSTGERQRTALARALLNEPSVLLADEPTGNLDTENSEIVLKRMRQFAESGGAVLLVTHDPLAAEQADRIVTMRDAAISH
ncbi:MAG: ABC transporter ATP-binding protein [Planctomycetaceae bacterium]